MGIVTCPYIVWDMCEIIFGFVSFTLRHLHRCLGYVKTELFALVYVRNVLVHTSYIGMQGEGVIPLPRRWGGRRLNCGRKPSGVTTVWCECNKCKHESADGRGLKVPRGTKRSHVSRFGAARADMQEEINMLEGTPFSAPPRNRNLPDDQQEDVEGASAGIDPQEPGSTIRGMETEGPAETDEDNPTEDEDVQMTPVRAAPIIDQVIVTCHNSFGTFHVVSQRILAFVPTVSISNILPGCA